MAKADRTPGGVCLQWKTHNEMNHTLKHWTSRRKSNYPMVEYWIRADASCSIRGSVYVVCANCGISAFSSGLQPPAHRFILILFREELHKM